MLHKRALPAIALRSSAADTGSMGESAATSRKVIGTVDRSLRSCRANKVVVALAVVSEVVNKRHLAAVIMAGGKAMQWSGEASRRMKSVTENSEWFTEQLQGGLVQVRRRDPRHDGGEVLLGGGVVLPPVVDASNDWSEVFFEDQVAEIAGRFVLNLAMQHLRRFLWM